MVQGLLFGWALFGASFVTMSVNDWAPDLMSALRIVVVVPALCAVSSNSSDLFDAPGTHRGSSKMRYAVFLTSFRLLRPVSYASAPVKSCKRQLLPLCRENVILTAFRPATLRFSVSGVYRQSSRLLRLRFAYSPLHSDCLP